MARNSINQNAAEEERKKEARRILNRVDRESEQFGTSSMARSANKVRDHFLGEESPEDDRIEVLGKRIARALSVAAFIALVVWLYINYVAPQ